MLLGDQPGRQSRKLEGPAVKVCASYSFIYVFWETRCLASLPGNLETAGCIFFDVLMHFFTAAVKCREVWCQVTSADDVPGAYPS